MDHSFIEIFTILIFALAFFSEGLLIALGFDYLAFKVFNKIKLMKGKNKND